MDIRIREISNISIIDIDGEINIDSSEIIEAVGWLIKNKKNNILLNFDKVNIVDYSGISILAIAYKNVANHKGKIKFCNVPLHVEELFKLVRLDNVFETYKNEEYAINTFYHDSAADHAILRRRFKRLGIQADAEFCEEKAEDKIWHSGKILNISGEGLFIHTKGMLSLGTKITMKLSLSGEEAITAKGIVIWLADKKLQLQSYPGMGISFREVTKNTQDHILNFINKHITTRNPE